jgi:hypothetical protein
MDDGFPGQACRKPGSPRGNLASDEEAAGSNPATPTQKPQVIRYRVACGAHLPSPNVRFWEPNGSGAGSLRPHGGD